MGTVRLEGLSVRLDPTNVERSVLARAAGARRHCFNFAVAAIRENHLQWQVQKAAGFAKADRVRPLSAIDLEGRWRRERPAWSGEVSSWVFSFACRDAAQACRNFLAGRAHLPRFAKKGRTRERFTVAGRDIRLEAGWVSIPEVGRVRIAGACPAQARLRRLMRRGRARFVSGTVSRHADGSWWLSLKVGRQVASPVEHVSAEGPAVGIDRGVKVTAVVATADAVAVDVLAARRRRRAAQVALGRSQRQAARRYQRGRRIEEQSAGWRAAQARIGRLHAKVARQRANDLHAFTRRLTDTHATIVIEMLATKNLMANRHLAGAIADQGWGELARHLAYKTQRRGGQILSAPRTFPSSKTCARCGWVRSKLSLDERTYRCDRCGHVADRDVNAAATLAAWGEHTLGRCPCVAQVRDPN
ncbi:MAG TPA: transposase, partial [Acidimicrobiia bacterium]